MADFEEGDAVEWTASQGRAAGAVVGASTAPVAIGDDHGAATPEDPQYLVKNDRTGAEAVHPDALRRKA